MLLTISLLLVRRLGFSTGHSPKPARSVAVVCLGGAEVATCTCKGLYGRVWCTCDIVLILHAGYSESIIRIENDFQRTVTLLVEVPHLRFTPNPLTGCRLRG